MEPGGRRRDGLMARSGVRTAAGRRSRARLRVRVSDERGRAVEHGQLDRWLATVAPAHVRGFVNVAIVDDRRVRALNRRYLGKNRETDVLSFPGPGPRFPAPIPFLGDIVIARGVA